MTHCPRCTGRLLRDRSEDGLTLVCVACGWEQARAATQAEGQRFVKAVPPRLRNREPQTGRRRA